MLPADGHYKVVAIMPALLDAAARARGVLETELVAAATVVCGTNSNTIDQGKRVRVRV